MPEVEQPKVFSLILQMAGWLAKEGAGKNAVINNGGIGGNRCHSAFC